MMTSTLKPSSLSAILAFIFCKPAAPAKARSSTEIGAELARVEKQRSKLKDDLYIACARENNTGAYKLEVSMVIERIGESSHHTFWAAADATKVIDDCKSLMKGKKASFGHRVDAEIFLTDLLTGEKKHDFLTVV